MNEVIEILLKHPMETLIIFISFYGLVRYSSDYRFRRSVDHQVGRWLRWNIVYRLERFDRWYDKQDKNWNKLSLRIRFIIWTSVCVVPYGMMIIYTIMNHNNYNLTVLLILSCITIPTVGMLSITYQSKKHTMQSRTTVKEPNK